MGLLLALALALVATSEAFVAVPSPWVTTPRGHVREVRPRRATIDQDQDQDRGAANGPAEAPTTTLAPPPQTQQRKEISYPVSRYNGPILGSMLVAAVGALLSRDAPAIAALYHFDSLMEADWAPESLKLLARLPSDLLADYGSAAVEHPVVVKACTSAVAYLVGDLIAQAYEGRREVAYLDLPRTFRNAVAGFALHGPILHAWIDFLEGPFTSFFLSNAGLAAVRPGSVSEYSLIASKIALDQTAFALSFNTIYSAGLGLLALKSLDEIKQNVRTTLIPSIFSSWKFWPIVHIVSYSPLVPVQYKLLWIDVMEIAWVAILSFIANDERQESGVEPIAKTFEDFNVQPAVEVVLSRQVEKDGDLCDLDYHHSDLRKR